MNEKPCKKCEGKGYVNEKTPTYDYDNTIIKWVYCKAPCPVCYGQWVEEKPAEEKLRMSEKREDHQCVKNAETNRSAAYKAMDAAKKAVEVAEEQVLDSLKFHSGRQNILEVGIPPVTTQHGHCDPRCPLYKPIDISMPNCFLNLGVVSRFDDKVSRCFINRLKPGPKCPSYQQHKEEKNDKEK